MFSSLIFFLAYTTSLCGMYELGMEERNCAYNLNEQGCCMRVCFCLFQCIEKDSSRIRAVDINNFRGLLDVRRFNLFGVY